MAARAWVSVRVLSVGSQVVDAFVWDVRCQLSALGSGTRSFVVFVVSQRWCSRATFDHVVRRTVAEQRIAVRLPYVGADGGVLQGLPLTVLGPVWKTLAVLMVLSPFFQTVSGAVWKTPAWRAGA